jgi:hypothetical protein
MNQQFSSNSSACQSHEVLIVASDLEAFMFYADYLLDLLKKAYPQEMKIRLRDFIAEVEESDLAIPFKEQIILSLQEILSLLLHDVLLHDSPNFCQQELELRLANLKSFMQLSSR